MQRYTKDLGPGAGSNDDDTVAMLSGPGVSEVELGELTFFSSVKA